MSGAVLFTDNQTGRQLLLADSEKLDRRTVTVTDPDSGDMFLMPTKALLEDYSRGSKRRRFRRRKGGAR